MNFIILIELQVLDPFKALFQMWLHFFRVSGLLQDTQQILIREEKEPREK